MGSKRILLDPVVNVIYNWSYHRGYIDLFYTKFITRNLRGIAEFVYFFDRYIIDGIINILGISNFFIGEWIKYISAGRISSYLLFYLSYVAIFLLISFLSF